MLVSTWLKTTGRNVRFKALHWEVLHDLIHWLIGVGVLKNRTNLDGGSKTHHSIPSTDIQGIHKLFALYWHETFLFRNQYGLPINRQKRTRCFITRPLPNILKYTKRPLLMTFFTALLRIYLLMEQLWNIIHLINSLSFVNFSCKSKDSKGTQAWDFYERVFDMIQLHISPGACCRYLQA